MAPRWMLTPVVLLATLAAPCLAVDSAVVEAGWTEGDADAERYGAAARWDLAGKWLIVGDWHLASYVELGVAYWDGENGESGENELVDFGLTPVLRYQHAPAGGLAPFVEFGVGVHGYTEDGIGDKEFDIPFAFGTHIGVGTRFGAGGQYELLYRFQHHSNAGLGDDNPGINWHAVQLGLHF
jgi:hypothetical protein